MNWRIGARIAFATLGLGVAATVFVWSRNQPAPAKPPVHAPRLDPNVSLAGGPGRLTIYKGDKPSMDVTSKASQAFEDGRWKFEGAVVKGLGDPPFTLRAAALETRGPAVKGEKPTQFDVSGGFTFEGADGMVVAGETGTYDDTTGVMTIPGAVTFKRGRLSGASNGATYAREQDTVTLLELTKAAVGPDAKGLGAAEVTAKRLLLAQGQRTVRLEENARIAGETQVLSANSATVGFTEDESALKHLELRGAAKVEAGPKAGTGQPAMTADNVTMSFHPDGVTMQHATMTGHAVMTTSEAGKSRSLRASWIDLFVAPDGKTLTRLDARDQVSVEIPATATTSARTITASTLQASGDEKRGLTQARFEGKPRFEEASAKGKREGTATALVLALGGQLDAIQSAQFEQNVQFSDDETRAWADRATYDDAKQLLQLRPNAREPRKLSRAETTDVKVDAQEIDLFLETENVHARGDVLTRTTEEPTTQKSKSSSLFEQGKPVIGTAPEFTYTRESGKGVYTGSAQAIARLKQDNTVVAANRVEFTSRTNRLDASGRVDSQIEVSAPSQSAKTSKLQRYRIIAETLAYDDTQRVAVYKGPKVTLTTEDGTTEATTLTFRLAKDSRELEAMRAEGSAGGVVATLSGGYEIQGDELVYEAATDTYTLRGPRAKIKSPPDKEQKDPKLKCKLTVGTVLKLDRRTETVDGSGSGQPVGAITYVDCATPIRSAK